MERSNNEKGYRLRLIGEAARGNKLVLEVVSMARADFVMIVVSLALLVCKYVGTLSMISAELLWVFLMFFSLSYVRILFAVRVAVNQGRSAAADKVGHYE